MKRQLVTHSGLGPLAVQRDDTGEPEAFVGYGAVFFRADDPGTEYRLSNTLIERVSPTAFAEIAQHDVRGLINHDPSQLLGRTPNSMQLSVDATGLRYEIPYDASDPDHVRLLAKIQRGDITGSSFAFKIEKESWEKREKTYYRTLERVKVYDVGPVTFPAYDATTATSRQLTESREEADQAVQKWEREQSDIAADTAYYYARLRLRELRA